jgi:hypothetical protein
MLRNVGRTSKPRKAERKSKPAIATRSLKLSKATVRPERDVKKQEPNDLPPQSSYSALSLFDLLDARDAYHVHLMRHPHVVATAIGYYRIRREDTPPGVKPKVQGHGPRTLMNSEVRAYSWPAVLVFVDEWLAEEEFAKGHRYHLEEMVPKTLYLRDGRQIPACVIEAPREAESSTEPPSVRYPLNNIGSGHPVLVDVQNNQHVATIACLVSDGHRTYALTNRHVTGEAGQEVSSKLGGRPTRIGAAAPLESTRVAFSELYPGWPGGSTYVKTDVGLIDIDDINNWTALLQGRATMGPMIDLSAKEFPLSLIGRHVRGYGAASQWMLGEIHALFYRYVSRGGFEYVSDFFIGPRTPKGDESIGKTFLTRPGDSGALWLLESKPGEQPIDTVRNSGELRPIAIQWGASRLYSDKTPGTYVLATCLSTICDRLDVDVVRDWNLDQSETWGAVGHFSIASRVAATLSNKVPTLTKLMTNNAAIVSHDDETILKSDFKGMGDDAFIPMADVPDFFWKHGKQGHSRGSEGPNHFADMDQKRPADGVDLLTLCLDPANVDPTVWNSFYDSVEDLLSGGAIEQQHRGLLPFRVWQIFDSMVAFVKDDRLPEFVCAAGVLTHYVGDACQPLHISYLHDGDPLQATSHVVHHRTGTQEEKRIPLGQGVHTAYEDAMVNANRSDILNGLDKTPKVKSSELVANGYQAAVKTIDLMRSTFRNLPPQDLLDTFVATKKKSDAAGELWSQFGKKTIATMQNGTHLLAVLWESAWVAGGGESKRRDTKALAEEQAMAICAAKDFVPSCTVEEISRYLSKPEEVNSVSDAPRQMALARRRTPVPVQNTAG